MGSVNSKHALWWQAYVAALSSGGVVDLPPKLTSKALDGAVLVDHQRAVALADLGIAELERRIAADEPKPEPPKNETPEEKREREAREAERREKTLFWSAGG